MNRPCARRILASIAVPVFVLAFPLSLSGCRRQTDTAPQPAAPPASTSARSETPAPAPPAAAPATPSNERTLALLPSLAPLVERVRPMTVNINSRFRLRTARGAAAGEGETPEDRFRRFFGLPGTPDQREAQGLGSGLYIGDGLVLTNNHMVSVQEQGSTESRPMDEIRVLTDQSAADGGREYQAKIVGTDPKTDIALLRIEGEHVKSLKPAVLGDSDALRVGDHVIAIGEPFGLEATVTAGIISAKERTLGPDTAYADFLQTDASINPGNSGGGLFNLNGEVIGINTAIIGGANNIGFAVPISLVKQILPQLKEKGRVDRGYLGVLLGPVTQDVADKMKLETRRGALVTGVERDGPAAQAGLKPGDVIVGADGKPVDDATHLTRAVGQHLPGSTMTLTVAREGTKVDVQVKLAERREEELSRRMQRLPSGRRGR